jgi:dephospho-CoA kinase
VLRVGLTGGIGSGKSTVARRLVELGAVLVDSDVLAREAVAPGTEGLAEIVAAFGDRVLAPDGALDRPALAAVVFGDRAARERLNGIVHPRVRARSDGMVAAARADAVVVQDVPLLVEGGMGPRFPLVVVVHVAAEERIRRLVQLRGMAEEDARARVAAQAGDEARRAAADVWLDNGGAPHDLDVAVDALWSERLVPFEENLRSRRPAVTGGTTPVGPDPRWAADAARLAARIAAAAGERGRGVDHVGPTAVPGMPAADVLDLQLGVTDLAAADAAREALEDAGFPRAGGESGSGRLHRSADPGRPARLYVREVSSPEWREALLWRDWLRTDRAARDEAPSERGNATNPWSEADSARAHSWAAASGWAPTLP